MRDPSLLLVGAASPIPFGRMLEHAAMSRCAIMIYTEIDLEDKQRQAYN